MGAKSDGVRTVIAIVLVRSGTQAAAVNINRIAFAGVRESSVGSQLSSRSIVAGFSDAKSASVPILHPAGISPASESSNEAGN